VSYAQEALVRHELLAGMYGALAGLGEACAGEAGATPRCLAAAAALYRAAPRPAANHAPRLLHVRTHPRRTSTIHPIIHFKLYIALVSKAVDHTRCTNDKKKTKLIANESQYQYVFFIKIM
jgi:hypothetical protein